MWARIVNDKVVEIIDIDPKGRFKFQIEKQFVKCDENINCEYMYDGEKFYKEIKEISIESYRKKRNDLLQETDLMLLLEDYTINGKKINDNQKQELINYRENLRNSTKTFYPDFPEKPTFIK